MSPIPIFAPLLGACPGEVHIKFKFGMFFSVLLVGRSFTAVPFVIVMVIGVVDVCVDLWRCGG